MIAADGPGVEMDGIGLDVAHRCGQYPVQVGAMEHQIGCAVCGARPGVSVEGAHQDEELKDANVARLALIFADPVAHADTINRERLRRP